MHVMNIPYRITSIMWNMIVCSMYVIACAFYMGSSPCRKTSLLGIAHPVVGPPFRYRVYLRRRRSDEAVIVKEADMWP